MNKTIIININGTVFHIEEDAYEMLQSYMTDVKQHFAYTADSEEIVTDIENRLAEMFAELLQQRNSDVIVTADVTDVIKTMGSANQFENPDEEQSFQSQNRHERKLYRDPDERVIGGVCAGLAYYFNIDIKWVRLLTFVATLLWGTGVIIYILLWAVVPEAKTRAEKMAMKGEPVNLQNIKRNFDYEVQNLSPGINKATNLIADLLKYVGKFLVKACKFIVKAFGVFLLIVSSLSLLSLLASLAGLLGLSDFYLNAHPFNALNPEYRVPVVICAFVISAIPFAALLIFTVKLLFNIRTNTRALSFSLLMIWLGGLMFSIYYATRISAEFRQEAKFEETTVLKSVSTLYLNSNSLKNLSKEDSIRFNLSISKIKIVQDDSFDNNSYSNVDIAIEKSADGKLSVTKQVSSKGRDFETALRYARNVSYNFVQADSALNLDKYLFIGNKSLYRGQEVKITVKIPENTKVIIAKELRWKIENLDFDACGEGDDYDKASRWIMSAGGMQCDTIRLDRNHTSEEPVPDENYNN